MNPCSACRRDVEPERGTLIRPDALQLEIAGEGERIRRVEGFDRELFGVFVVDRRAGVEKFVSLARERVARVQNATEGLIGQRLPSPRSLKHHRSV